MRAADHKAVRAMVLSAEPVVLFCRDCGHNYILSDPTQPGACGKCGGSKWVR